VEENVILWLLDFVEGIFVARPRRNFYLRKNLPWSPPAPDSSGSLKNGNGCRGRSDCLPRASASPITGIV
jgi:hypothetical protein